MRTTGPSWPRWPSGSSWSASSRRSSSPDGASPPGRPRPPCSCRERSPRSIRTRRGPREPDGVWWPYGRWACVRGRSLLRVPPADRDGHGLANDLLLGLNGGVKGAFTLVRGMTSRFRLGSFGPGRESEEVERHPGMGHAGGMALKGTLSLILHAATASYSWIRPQRTSIRRTSGTSAEIARSEVPAGVRRSRPRWGEGCIYCDQPPDQLILQVHREPST